MGTYLCLDCGERVEYSGGVPVRYLCSSCKNTYDWETLDWKCAECGYVRRTNTYYNEPDESPLRMVCHDCSTDDRTVFRDFEVEPPNSG